jgi:hypothetical protein
VGRDGGQQGPAEDEVEGRLLAHLCETSDVRTSGAQGFVGKRCGARSHGACLAAEPPSVQPSRRALKAPGSSNHFVAQPGHRHSWLTVGVHACSRSACMRAASSFLQACTLQESGAPPPGTASPSLGAIPVCARMVGKQGGGISQRGAFSLTWAYLLQ